MWHWKPLFVHPSCHTLIWSRISLQSPPFIANQLCSPLDQQTHASDCNAIFVSCTSDSRILPRAPEIILSRTRFNRFVINWSCGSSLFQIKITNDLPLLMKQWVLMKARLVKALVEHQGLTYKNEKIRVRGPKLNIAKWSVNTYPPFHDSWPLPPLPH